MSDLTGVDYFTNSGYRRLALAMLEDAVSEIAKNGDTSAACLQRAWLAGETDSAITAQMCIEAVGGPSETGLQKLRDLVSTDPQAAQRALRAALANFNTWMTRSPEDGSEARMSQYRSMAQAH